MPHAVTKDECQELSTEELQLQLSNYMRDRQGGKAMKTLAFKSIQQLSGELLRRRAEKCEQPENFWL